MSLKGQYQNGYVTRDLDRAMELAGGSFGLGAFTAFDVEMVANTPTGEKTSHLRVATAWAGAIQVELIQPIGGFVDPYLPFLPTDPADAVPRLHHIAVRRDDPVAMRAEAQAMGLPLAFTSEGAGISCIFLDARRRLGHYFEFVTANPQGWELLGWPEGLVLS
ncbi:MAG: hypothetical protein EOP13_00195 [Pseudomonas sp.]|uniref:VOC family protein n=1 Tax=Pseudomonas sp. TaxID=306 RepID=UPI001219A37F|nr:VOC family protein [Pseudomonas sp.]RZI76946.1 MAG: hypothetical protein EOP13_00195 [Pseudomonas sp.]